MKKFKIIFAILVNIFFISDLAGQDQTEILNALQKFKTGYELRDTLKAASFVDALFTKDVLLIGTGSDEWLPSQKACVELIKNDWKYWFNVELDLRNVAIKSMDNNYASFVTLASASMSFPSKDVAYSFALNLLKQSVEKQRTDKEKVLTFSREASDLVREIERGTLDVAYELRISGMMKREGREWKFSQLTFSFPYPMKRVSTN